MPAAKPARIGDRPYGPGIVEGTGMVESLWRPDVLGIIAGCTITIVAIVASIAGKTICDRSRFELKRAMVERGMTADDIERVLTTDATR